MNKDKTNSQIMVDEFCALMRKILKEIEKASKESENEQQQQIAETSTE